MRANVDQMKPTDLHPGWVWNDVSRENFESNLSLPYFKEQFEALENSANLSPAELAKSIKILLLENTKISRIKEKRMFKDDSKISEPWFDSECRKKKEDINSLGKKIQKTPQDQSLRTLLSNEKKSFRRTILLKK